MRMTPETKALVNKILRETDKEQIESHSMRDDENKTKCPVCGEEVESLIWVELTSGQDYYALDEDCLWGCSALCLAKTFSNYINKKYD